MLEGAFWREIIIRVGKNLDFIEYLKVYLGTSELLTVHFYNFKFSGNCLLNREGSGSLCKTLVSFSTEKRENERPHLTLFNH